MKDLHIKGSKQIPEITFMFKSGNLEISGRSIPENSFEFYNPIIEWMNKYSENPNKQTKVKIYLEYYNTSSSKYLFDIFRKLENIHNEDNDNIVVVEWYYDKDVDEMIEMGEDFSDLIKVPFEIKLKG